MKLNRKGFTLLEMLIVIAIVAVLISVAVPVLSSQLERSREAVDLANVRSAYAPGLHGGPAWKYPCHRHGQSEAEAGRVAVGEPREHRRHRPFQKRR